MSLAPTFHGFGRLIWHRTLVGGPELYLHISGLGEGNAPSSWRTKTEQRTGRVYCEPLGVCSCHSTTAGTASRRSPRVEGAVFPFFFDRVVGFSVAFHFGLG